VDKKSKIHNDRSGLSRIQAIIVIVIMVVVVASLTYVAVAGSLNNSETIAPGTSMTYVVSENGVEKGTVEESIVGQNATEYLYMIKIDWKDPAIQYVLSPKEVPKDTVTAGTEEIDTIDGTKTLKILEYSDTSMLFGPRDVKSYVDQHTGAAYRNEITYNDPASLSGAKITQVQLLKAYYPVTQKSYKESGSIGKTFEYASVGLATFPASIVCVADCLDDKYGVMYDLTAIAGGSRIYCLSDNIQGLPTDAVKTEATAEIAGTLDGDVSVEILKMADGDAGLTFYYEPNTHIIYRIVLTVSGTDSVFDLVSKP